MKICLVPEKALLQIVLIFSIIVTGILIFSFNTQYKNTLILSFADITSTHNHKPDGMNLGQSMHNEKAKYFSTPADGSQNKLYSILCQ